MAKLLSIMENLGRNLLDFFVPESELNYDEATNQYFWKPSCKKFIAGKPIRFVSEVWCLNTKSTSFVWESSCSSYSYDEFSEKKTIPYTFYFDSLFTTFTLLKCLKSKGYIASGTNKDTSFIVVQHIFTERTAVIISFGADMSWFTMKLLSNHALQCLCQ